MQMYVFGFDMSQDDVLEAKENFKDFDENSLESVRLVLQMQEDYLG